MQILQIYHLFYGLVDEDAYPLDLRDGERLARLLRQRFQVRGHGVGQGVVGTDGLLFLKWDKSFVLLIEG